MKIKNIISKTSFIYLLTPLMILMAVYMSSCSNSDTKVIINGKISNVDKKNITIEALHPNKIENIQTFKINKKGNFEFNLKNIDNCFYRIKVDEDNLIYLYLKENDEININANYPEISREYTLTGSYESLLLKEMHTRLLLSSDTIKKMRELLIEAHYINDYNTDSLQKIFSHNALEIFNADKQFLINFIHRNTNSPVIYMALYQYLDSSPILSIENDFEIFEFVLENLKKYNPELEQITLLESAVSKQNLKLQNLNSPHAKLTVGTKAPDFIIKDVESKNVSIDDFKGKKIYLYFWASWSKSSTDIINSLVELRNNNNIEIILLSLDSNTENWKKAISSIKNEKIINVCDFKTWESPIIKVYGIHSLPTLFILDENYIIEFISQDIETIIENINKGL